MKYGLQCLFFIAGTVALSALYAPAAQAGFVHASGTSLFLDGQRFVPRGVGHMDVTSLWTVTSSALSENWITEKDFATLSRAGFNSIRLAVKTDYFQDPAPPHRFNEKNFAWLDKRLAWAKRHGLKLILDMHMPTGGTPQDYRVSPATQKFWDDPWLRGRFVDVWREIAKRYSKQEAIWAYDLMNEPATWDFAAYEKLMQATTRAIRTQDDKHALIIQPGMLVLASGQVQFKYPEIADGNVAHALHFYQPVEFTHQSVYWGVMGDKAKTAYPDPPSVKNAWTDTDTRLAFEDAFAAAATSGRPVVLTEFGTVFHQKETGQVRWIQDVLAAARAKNTGWHYWYYKGPAYVGEMGLTTRWGTPRPRTWSVLKAANKP